jgi:signal transduction histidine kinase
VKWPRPLDRLEAIKIKFGVVAVGTAVTSALLVKWGADLGVRGLYTLPVAVLGSLAVTQFLAHGMTSPLREMTSAVREMAQGDYHRRIRVTSRDEVGVLGDAFNQMAGDLAEVERQRREFVANVSHELRTPITALRAVLENVADGVTSPTPEVLEGALVQTERLGRLVTQLLDLSRVDAGAGSLDLTWFELAPFLSTAITEATANRPDPGLGPVFEVRAADGLLAFADRDRLHQVVANLLDNAARHSPPGGAVTICASSKGESLLLQVADEGPGIPVAERTRVFDRFSRGGAADGGTGLGLAIARWAVELHGGEISVGQSVRGCRIDVVLPLTGRRP